MHGGLGSVVAGDALAAPLAALDRKSCEQHHGSEPRANSRSRVPSSRCAQQPQRCSSAHKDGSNENCAGRKALRWRPVTPEFRAIDHERSMDAPGPSGGGPGAVRLVAR
ncbi:MAG: hypothetical protein JWO21_414 [Solirubrobacterales bacterium]|nr:hypothetical protein [Solirubrobacterales bacterium]